MKFKYSGEFNGRTEWGEVEANDFKEAQLKLIAFGIENVQRLTASDGRNTPLIPAHELLHALLGDKRTTASGNSEHWFQRMVALEALFQLSASRFRGDPSLMRTLKRAAECGIPDIQTRAVALQQGRAPTRASTPTNTKKWWQFWK